MVAGTSGGIVVCVSDQGGRFLPGGTREPGEAIEDTVDRELREEAGARRVGDLEWLGAHRAVSRRVAPYRPHLPHPVAYWAYGWAEVVIDSKPSNPPDGETVVEVRVLPPVDAAAFLAGQDQVHADVVRLATALRS